MTEILCQARTLYNKIEMIFFADWLWSVIESDVSREMMPDVDVPHKGFACVPN